MALVYFLLNYCLLESKLLSTWDLEFFCFTSKHAYFIFIALSVNYAEIQANNFLLFILLPNF